MSHDALIRQLLENPDEVVCSESVREPGFFDTFIRHVLSVCDAEPAQSLPMFDIGLRIVTHSCQSVQTWGLRAAAHRTLGALEQALAMLELASTLAGPCQRCHGFLTWRRAKVYASLGRIPEAFADADAGIEAYQALGAADDHDLDDNGLANAFLGRGSIRHYVGVPLENPELLSGSVSDVTTALDLTVPSVSPVLYRTALFNLSVALYSTGRRSDLELADRHLRTARNYFRGPTKPSQERAKVAWATAMVRHELGGHQPCRVRGMLELALSDFLAVDLVAEACAVASDLSKIAFPDRDRIRGLMEETAQRVTEWIGADFEVRRKFSVLGESVERVRDAASVQGRGWRDFAELRRSIDELREACGPKVLACLVSWPLVHPKSTVG